MSEGPLLGAARALAGAARRVLAIPARAAFVRRLERTPLRLASGGPVLNYGSVLPQEKGALVQGGRVKLLHLARAFPEAAQDFNLLYLVSSAIPPHALELVRWAKSHGAKLLWNQNGVGFPAWAGAHAESINAPMRALLAEADFVFYQSEFCRESADQFLGPARCEHALVFNPVDTRVFTPAAEPPALQPVRLLTAGTHHQAYRVTGALECLAELKKAGVAAHLTIAGGLRWRGAQAQIEALVTSRGLRDAVAFSPAYSQKEAAALFQNAHFLLHPKFNDPCPTVVLEAMACGLPVIGSASGGMPELVGEEGGRLLRVPAGFEKLEPPDPVEMARAVAELLEDWPAHSRAACERARRLFSKELWIDRHRAVFERLAP